MALILSGEVLAEPKIDATSQETFKTSLEAMKHELSPNRVAALDSAIFKMPFSGFDTVQDMLKHLTPDGRLELDIKKLDGLTADQIIELARKTVTVKFRSGPPPGLPSKFKEPLPLIENPEGVASVAGTQWEITSNINGNLSVDRVTLKADGGVVNGSSTNGHWEQAGSSVRIALNDDYVVYLGTLDAENSMKGAAANIDGFDWSWAAIRSQPDVAVQPVAVVE
jgi:hypothetical protein